MAKVRMKIRVYSQDAYLTAGVNELIKSIPLNGIYCGGSITIIDLSTSGFLLHSDFFSRECCHAVLIVNNINIEYWLRRVPLCFDAHIISGTVSPSDFTEKIKKLIINIMCLTCYWEGVKGVEATRLTMENSLSRRECEVLKLYCMGLTVKDIARQLVIDPKTVSVHKRAVMKRLALKSNANLLDIHQQINNIEAIISAQEKRFTYRLTSSQQCRLISAVD
ncbi:LuxR family transcriptional regulator [Yersinia sp. Marseille-Q3913]|uniref:helix-turn-helix transcriptional regulator n=1 Tax=Yersinia sp. Marseille-Q3913 TaxID=2830769 RepID=UPI0020111F95|nr:LuxR family transcriptional regulator [Yersinia sp. Marseille-Q3913]